LVLLAKDKLTNFLNSKDPNRNLNNLLFYSQVPRPSHSQGDFGCGQESGCRVQAVHSAVLQLRGPLHQEQGTRDHQSHHHERESRGDCNRDDKQLTLVQGPNFPTKCGSDSVGCLHWSRLPKCQ
jgi:hypothetical protein